MRSPYTALSPRPGDLPCLTPQSLEVKTALAVTPFVLVAVLEAQGALPFLSENESMRQAVTGEVGSLTLQGLRQRGLTSADS